MRDAYARRAFDLLDRISGMQQPEQVFGAFYSAIRGLGFETFIISGLLDPRRRCEQMCT